MVALRGYHERKAERIKDIALAVRAAGSDEKGWKKFLKAMTPTPEHDAEQSVVPFVPPFARRREKRRK